MLRFIVFLFLMLMLSTSIAFGKQKEDNRESKIGGFNFTSKLITNKQLIQIYGKGCADKDYPYHYRRMYYFPKEHIFAAFNIETDDLVVGLRLTKEPIASKRCMSKQSLKSTATGRGLSIGDTEETVVRLYGQPGHKRKNNDIVKYEYYVGREEGPFMTVEIGMGRVRAIDITVGD